MPQEIIIFFKKFYIFLLAGILNVCIDSEVYLFIYLFYFTGGLLRSLLLSFQNIGILAIFDGRIRRLPEGPRSSYWPTLGIQAGWGD